MKISIKKALIKYIVYFPLIHVVFFSVLQGGYTNILYILSEVTITMVAIRYFKISQKDAVLLGILVIFIPIGYIIHQYSDEIPIIINFIYFVSVAFVLNNDKFKIQLLDYIKKSERKITTLSIVYILIIVSSVLLGSGVVEGWGTTTLKGPYGTPHTLAYEIIVLICLNLIILLNNVRQLNITIVFVFIAMSLFTAARSALIGLFIILLFFFSRFGISKKILILIGSVAVGSYVLLSTQMLNPLLEKSNLAISNGSISNGRMWIFESSINTFMSFNGGEKWVVGIGYDKLLAGNSRLIHYAIQAHNDILNALIAFGVIFCVIFVYSIFRMVKGSNGYFYKLSLLMALINLNGLVSYMSFAIPITIVLTFLESPKVDSRRIIRHRNHLSVKRRKSKSKISVPNTYLGNNT